jgi:uncharacterized RDD family membrane protein YckC
VAEPYLIFGWGDNMDSDTVLAQGASAQCAECGGTFAVDDMIQHGAAYVCAKCKPIFLQKLAEGADISGGKMRYAGFWYRVGASLLDGLILFIVGIGVQVVLGIAMVSAIQAGASTPQRLPVMVILQQLIGFAVAILYETIFLGRFGATLGKMALKIHVVTGEGDRLTYLRAFARYFAKLVSFITLCIGYLMAAFDPQAGRCTIASAIRAS